MLDVQDKLSAYLGGSQFLAAVIILPHIYNPGA